MPKANSKTTRLKKILQPGNILVVLKAEYKHTGPWWTSTHDHRLKRKVREVVGFRGNTLLLRQETEEVPRFDEETDKAYETRLLTEVDLGKGASLYIGPDNKTFTVTHENGNTTGRTEFSIHDLSNDPQVDVSDSQQRPLTDGIYEKGTTPWIPEEVRGILFTNLRERLRGLLTRDDLSLEEKLDSAVFGVFTTLDGVTLGFPSVMLSLDIGPEDVAWLQARGLRWYVPDQVISRGQLHDAWRQ